MTSLLICPRCGGGLSSRRGMRRHLGLHGWDADSAFALTTAMDRTGAPSVWRCLVCRRKFSTVRGLFRHAKVAHPAQPRRGAARPWRTQEARVLPTPRQFP